MPSAAPPHDLEMEESLLGAMLLRVEAVEAGLATVTAGDFYKPAHGLIFASIAGLAARNDPVDSLTVADELRRTGLLAEMGDPAELVNLRYNCPSAASAGHYARRVAELATQRRLLGHALELVDAVKVGDDERRDAAVEAISGDSGGIATGLVVTTLADLIAHPPPRIEPELLQRVDGKCLLLRGEITGLHAEPTAGKSWLAAEAVRQVTAAGGAACVVDYEDHDTTWAQRLAELGLTADQARGRLAYVEPNGTGVALVVRRVLALEPDLIVIDSMAYAMAQAGLDEDHASECLSWIAAMPGVLAKSGAAVLLIDHVVKDKAARGRWGRGSSGKLHAFAAAFSLKVVAPYARGVAGQAHLIVAKDRHGAIGPEGSVAASVRFEPQDGDGLRIVIEPAAAMEGEGGWHGPTDCMKAVLQVLQSMNEELSANQLYQAVRSLGGGKGGFRKTTVQEAAERLAMDPEQPIIARTGGNRARLFRHDPGAKGLELDWRDEDF